MARDGVDCSMDTFLHSQSTTMSVLRDIARLLLFEWLVFNTTSLFVALSSVGLPSVKYATSPSVIITMVSASLQYLAFLIYYIRKRRTLLTWTLRNTYTALSPLVAVLIGSAFIFCINYVNYPFIEEIRDWFAVTIGLILCVTVVVPGLIHGLILEPLKHRARERQLTRLLAPLTKMEAAVVRKCREAATDPAELESLVLVGLGIEEIAGLDACAQLKRLYISCNRIRSAHGLENLKALELLDLQNNEIASFHALVPLRALPRLARITIDRNPLTTRPDAGFSLPRLVALLPSLQRVNGARITSDVRAKAAAYQNGWVEAIVATHQRNEFDEHMRSRAASAPLGSFLPAFVAAREHGLLALDPLARRGAPALRKRGDEAQLYASLTLAEREEHVRQAYAAGTLPVVRDVQHESKCGALLLGPQLLHTCLRLDSILNHEVEAAQSADTAAAHAGPSAHHTPRSRSSQSLPATPLRMAAPLLDPPSVSEASAAPEPEPVARTPPRAARSLHRRLNSDQLDDHDDAPSRLAARRSRAALLRDSLPAFELAVIAAPEPIPT